ncbi:LCP family protein [Candidatus Leptofilum sp.]|uniref:LCP family glycopolymer transferase n=1 Tax=Candidatus Leptofilum sp. TaxID=3241576 RepID=UPI003B5C1941
MFFKSKKLAATSAALSIFLIVMALFLAGCASETLRTPLPTLAATVAIEVAEVGSSATPQPATNTPEPSATPTPAGTNTPGPSPTPSNTATAMPTQTAAPTSTPTSLPQLDPVLTVDAPVDLIEGIPTPSTAVPTAVPTFEVPDSTTNILLLGSDTAIGSNDTRTDTMIIVSVNQDGPSASMISLPRDLYVYIPGKTMNRLNTALSLGGVELLKQTILYNFGIPIHYYARVDFQGFETAVDAIGGVDIAVSCRLQDWRLISPELNPEDEDNWEQFALEPGLHHMDGDTALWFARSRLSTNDFDRGRRQQQLLRGLLNEGVDLGLLSNFPSLWDAYKENVETDMDIGRILQLATLAPSVRQNGVQHLYLVRGIEPWETPSGAQVQLPVWEGENNLEETFSRLFRVPALNRANRRPITVEIVNASGNPDMALLAADNLAWYGFVPIIGAEAPEPEQFTQIFYYRPNFKDSFDWMISWIFDMYRSEIQLTEDDTFEYEYKVILGEDYDPCLNQLYQPQEFIN